MSIRELPAADTPLAYEAMLELRPNIGSESEFVARVNDVQRAQRLPVGRLVRRW